MLAAADVALVASGTVTVQAALHECPMVVVYRLSPLTYRLGKPFVHVDTYAMANLVAGRRVVPELIQDEFTPDARRREALRVLTDPAHAAAVRRDLREVRGKLGTPGASRRAAEAVIEVARQDAREAFESRLLEDAPHRSLVLAVSAAHARLARDRARARRFREIVAGSQIIVYGRVADVHAGMVRRSPPHRHRRQPSTRHRI